MARIFVTTTADEVAADGLLSLREAVAIAGARDTIVFRGVVPIVSLASPLVIDRSLTIDGGLTGLNQVRGGSISGQVVVASGADVTIRNMTLSAGFFGADAVADASNGDFGENGTSGQNGRPPNQPGEAGGDGSPGGAGGAPSAPGLGEFGTIVNDGRLTLENVEVMGSFSGGDGAGGGAGRGGGGGGRGGDGFGLGKGANAGNGADGGDGGDGSDGGDVVSGVWNRGVLVLRDTLIHGNTATGGRGGDGGPAGVGGAGGPGGAGGFVLDRGVTIRQQGGNGGVSGDGGAGGDGGDGGTAIAGLLNEGRVRVVGAAIFYDNEAEGGAGGDPGAGGLAFPGGSGGSGDPEGLDGLAGLAGAPGARGVDGAAVAGVAGAGPTAGAFSVDAHFHALARGFPTTGVTFLNGAAAAATPFSFSVQRFGDAFDASGVSWSVRVTGGDLAARDFVGGLPRGRIAFGDGGAIDSTVRVDFSLKAGVRLGETSSFEFALRSPSAGDLLGSDSSLAVTLFRATNRADVLRGSDREYGGDRLDGFGGADRLFGRGGLDTLSGGAGADTLSGDAGDDLLNGGAMADVLLGGDGADLFQFGLADSRGPRRDVIRDFSVADGDAISLAFDADTGEAGFQSFAFRGRRGFTGEGGELRVVALSGPATTRVEADVNGDRRADFSLDIAGRHVLTAETFDL